MQWIWCEIKRSRPNSSFALGFSWRDRGKRCRASVMIFAVPTKIRTRKLPNINQKGTAWVNLLHVLLLSRAENSTLQRTLCFFIVHLMGLWAARVFGLYHWMADSVCLSVYGCITIRWALAAFSVSWFYTNSVGLRRKAVNYTQHKHTINAHRHPCLEWDSNPRSQG
jgi:hypothetical protein